MVAERSLLGGLADIREGNRVFREHKTHVSFSNPFSLQITGKSIEEVLLSGQYDQIDPELLKRWDYYRFDNLCCFDTITVKLAQFDTTIKCGDVVLEIFRDSLVNSFFPGHHSLLEFGCQYPDEQRIRPIVSFDPLGRVICLFGDEKTRGVGLGCYEYEWSAQCAFLIAVPRMNPAVHQ